MPLPNRYASQSKCPPHICPEGSTSPCTCGTPLPILHLLQAWKYCIIVRQLQFLGPVRLSIPVCYSSISVLVSLSDCLYLIH